MKITIDTEIELSAIEIATEFWSFGHESQAKILFLIAEFFFTAKGAGEMQLLHLAKALKLNKQEQDVLWIFEQLKYFLENLE